ncbi:hypothetical protein ACSNOH_09335, partial [Streptomyces sp. URMC 127]
MVSAAAAGLVVAPLLAGPAASAAPSGWRRFAVPHTGKWTVPKGVTRVRAYVWGAGAGGGSG